MKSLLSIPLEDCARYVDLFTAAEPFELSWDYRSCLINAKLLAVLLVDSRRAQRGALAGHAIRRVDQLNLRDRLVVLRRKNRRTRCVDLLVDGERQTGRSGEVHVGDAVVGDEGRLRDWDVG